jgi:Ca2+/H+ antiporter
MSSILEKISKYSPDYTYLYSRSYTGAPNYTTSVRGPYYNTSQLIFAAVVSLILYGSFIMVQTVRHKDYFVTEGESPAT